MPHTTGLVSTYPRLYRGVTQDLFALQAATGTSQIYELPQDEFGPPTRVSIDVTTIGGTASIDIEGSDDPAFGTGQVAKLITAITTVGKQFIVDKPVRYIRANQTAIASGSSTVRATNDGRG